MKKLFLLMIPCIISGALIAQKTEKVKPSAPPSATKENTAKEKPGNPDAGVKEEKPAPSEMKGGKAHHNKFECPKCHMQAEKPGKCSMCKIEMIEAKAEMKKEKAEMKGEKHEGHDHGHGHGDGHGHDKKPVEKKAE